MAQVHIYKWLQEQRASGNHKFFTVAEVMRGMKSDLRYTGNCAGVWYHIIALENYGFIEVKMTNKWSSRKLIRLKKEYVGV